MSKSSSLDITKLLKEFKAAIEYRAVTRFSDPHIGLEYNKIQPNRYVSRHIWEADIARSSRIARDIGNVDMQGSASKVNSKAMLLHYQLKRINGRT